MQRKLIQVVETGLLKSDIPEFKVGDTVIVHQKLLDGAKERVQTFEGDVIARNGSGIREMITVRRLVQGEGVERIFLIHSPRVARIDVKKAGMVRRAKLYYIRDRVGKAIKIRGDVKRQTMLDTSAAKASQEAAAVKAAVAREQTATTGESKRAAKRKAKADTSKK